MSKTINAIGASPVQILNGDSPVTILSGSGIITNQVGFAALYDIGAVTTGTVTIANAGILTDTFPASTGVYLANGGTILNQEDALITGDMFGISIASSTNSYIYNEFKLGPFGGTIAASGAAQGTAIEIVGSASINNDGLITAYSAGIVAPDMTHKVSINNFRGGTISAGSAGALFGLADAVFGAYASIQNAGLIAAQGYAVSGTKLTVLNTGGSIQGGGFFGTGVSISGPGVVQNQFQGMISGSSAGIFLSNITGTSVTVTNISSGTIQGGKGIYGGFDGGAAMITNTATIQGTGAYSIGINLKAGGAVTNMTGGTITGSLAGIYAGGNGGQSAYVTNASGGTISGVEGAANAIPWTVVNAGIINGLGIFLQSGGTVTNQPGGTIGGSVFGIAIQSGGTIVNMAGATITVTSGPAVDTQSPSTVYNAGYIGTGDPTQSNVVGLASGSELQLMPGASFGGDVEAAQQCTLRLLAGASTGHLDGLGTKYLDFQSVIFNPGASWQVDGKATSVDKYKFLSVTNADGFDIAGITGQTVASFTPGLLVLNNASGALDFTMNIYGPSQASQFMVADDGGGGTVLFVQCFVSGTSIRTDAGPVPVEHLRPGMRAIVASGEAKEIVWVGHRDIDCRRHPSPARVRPVRIARDVFGPGRPARPLMLSPDHAVFVGGVLIPIRQLIDGRAITQVAAERVTYHHVELTEHDILLAEGLPCESFLDTGHRANFTTGGDVVRSHPDFGVFDRRVASVWETMGSAPLVFDGPPVTAARAEIALWAARADCVAG